MTGPLLPGASKDRQTVTADWKVLQAPLAGVELRAVQNVIRDSGHLTEVFRREWFGQDVVVDQVFQATLHAGAASGWHVHLDTTDRLFVNRGEVKIVLYDARPGSETYGAINEFRLGEPRPGLVIVPAGVWHGLRNLSSAPGSVLNLVDRAYSYEDPDHWRVPLDSPEIPYQL